MLAKARQVLVGELALADNVDDAKADSLLADIDATIERQRASGVSGADAAAKSSLDDDFDVDLDDLNFDDED